MNQRPLRVMTFLHSFEPGGVERVALRLSAAWAARGVDTHLVLGRSDGAMRAEWPDTPYRSIAIPGLSTGRFETLWMILRLPGAIRRARPDILFCAGNTYAVVSVAMKLLLGRRCPPIVAKISNDLARSDLIGPARRAYRLWLKIQGKRIDHFIGMAQPMADEIAQAMQVPASRVTIINDPAISADDLIRLSRPRIRDDAPGTRFIAVGRLVAQKNFPLLLHAFAAMAGAEDRLTILGDGPERGALERLVDTLGIGAKVALPGHVHPVEAPLRASDIFVLSSDYEGVPAVVIEALAVGLPIIATDCSVSMASLLDDGARPDGVLGALVPVRDLPALAQAMRATARTSDPAPAHAHARASQFTVERAAGAYITVFETLVTHACHSSPL